MPKDWGKYRTTCHGLGLSLVLFFYHYVTRPYCHPIQEQWSQNDIAGPCRSNFHDDDDPIEPQVIYIPGAPRLCAIPQYHYSKMAEAAVAPLTIAGAQGTWFVVQKIRRSHPKYRLRKWEDRVDRALEKVQKQHLRIQSSDMAELMQENAMYYLSIPLIAPRSEYSFILSWARMAGRFKTDLENKKMGLFAWRARIGHKEMWNVAKDVERRATVRFHSTTTNKLSDESY